MILTTRVLRECGRRFSSAAAAHSGREGGRRKLVILGTGWGSYSLLRHINKKLFDVIVVSPRNHFLFTPLLASTTVGTLEFRSIIEPIRNTGFRDEHHFHLSHATRLDTERQVVECVSALDPASGSYDVSYDLLVIGVGAIPNDFNIPGVKEHALFLKEISDARRIRNQILTNFELATQAATSAAKRERLLHFVIVGGGPTGVEFGAEFYDFLRQDLNRLFPEERNMVRVTLVEAKEILSSFDHKLRDYTKRIIKKRSNMSIHKASVTEMTSEQVKLSDGSVLASGMVVWSTGVAPRDFTKGLSLEKTQQGQIVVDAHLKVVRGDARGRVYALGDCAHVEGHSLPCTAQAAERQGKYLAKALSSEQPEPFVFKPWGMLAYVGGYKALHDTPMGKSQGFHSWILWRSAYTTQLGSWRLRMQVPIDWMKAFFFGRDTSRF